MYSALLLIVLAISPALAAEHTQSAGTFHADSALVLVHVSVVDSHDRPVTDLDRRQFRVFEDGIEQTIATFEHADSPLSIGLVFDASGSMDGKMALARDMVARFCENLNPEDEIFLVTVQGTARLVAGFTRNCAEIQSALLFTKPNGVTALLDAIPIAFERLHGVRNRRKAILLISDGGENASRAKRTDIRRLAREADVPIYAAALTGDAHPSTMEEMAGPELIDDIIEYSGGRRWVIDTWHRPAESTRKIAAELHDQYVIGYRAPSPIPEGKYRRIAVKIARESGTPRLSVAHRGGYVGRTEP